MLSLFDNYQKALLTAYRALCDAEPPSRSELRRMPNVLGAESRTNLHMRDALHELSRASGSYKPAPSDWRQLGALPTKIRGPR